MPYVYDNLPAGTDKMWELNQRLRALLYAVKTLSTLLAGRSDISFEPVLLQMLKDLPPTAERIQELQKRLNNLGDTLNEI
jgi:hypothetical protein